MDIENKALFKSECFINGKWIKSINKEVIKVNNPANQEIIGEVPKCGAKETNIAINAANNAWENWKNKSAKDRSLILKKWFELIMYNQKDLAKIMTLEQGKPFSESFGEISYGASFVELYAEEAKRIYGDTIPDPLLDRRTIVIKQPVESCSRNWCNK